MGKTGIIIYSISIVLIIVCSSFQKYDGENQYQPFDPDGIPFTVSDTLWDVDGKGNHRALVHVKRQENNAVLAVLPWRRPDLRPETKKIIVTEALSGKEIKNVLISELSSEKGIIVFEPETVPGDYFIYYLPYKYRKGYGDARYGKPWNDYIPPNYEIDQNWKEMVINNLSSVPKAEIKRFESRSKFDFFTSMGVIATKKEQDKLLINNNSDYLVFPEDRTFPIRLTSLPYRWIEKGPSLEFKGNASRNEFYTWQIGLWAAEKGLNNIKVALTDFIHESGTCKISKELITCFNLEGINWNGKTVRFDINVPKNKVQALWFGVQIPSDAKTGKYKGEVEILASNSVPKIVKVEINVDKNFLSDKGDSDLWRHSRLRWLNSTIGIDSFPVTPYRPMELNENIITATDKYVKIGKNGTINSIKINGYEIFERPFQFVIESDLGKILFSAADFKVKQDADGLVSWTSESISNDGIKLICTAYMEYDGFIHYNIKLSSNDVVHVKNISLINCFTLESSEYFMGAGFKGGFCPDHYVWKWDGPYDSFWIGGDKSGLHIELRGGSYHGPLLNDYKPQPPKAWYNNGLGCLKVDKNKDNVKVNISTGKQVITRDPLNFEFALLITPVKSLDTKKHFSQRYYHSDPDGFAKAAEEGANIINIHHSYALNPVINYPFIIRDPLINYIEEQHKFGRKVKLYYTIRELTNHAIEIFALKSFNHEIFVSGVGYGVPWLCEHLIDDYKPAWYTELPNQNSDAALVLSPFSRWINYYLEGLRWMLENYEIDGIYLDDVSFDRTVMKRIRKILEEYRPGSLIDLHSNTGYSIGPANQYTDFFPYVDRLWFGESFRYNEMMPDEWFVTFSGIPFGVMSEMLQDGGNRFLGMVYGATARHSYSKYSPAPMWKLWDDFKIGEAEMIGYWDKECPVKTNHQNVKATVFAKSKELLIAVGNFDDENVNVQLIFDLEKLGMNPKNVTLEIPEIKDFQEGGIISINDKINIKSKEGVILLLNVK